MKTITSLLLFLFIGTGSLSAQLLDGPQSYTKGDSLRGTLSQFRSCYDVHYYHLDISVDPEQKRIWGSNRIDFKSTAPMKSLQIDLFDNMQIDSILAGGKVLKYRREYNAVFVILNEKLNPGELRSLVVYYSGNPTVAKMAPWDGGFTWSEDKNGNDWIGVSCEGIGASLWWPNKDHLSDEPDSMTISVRVPEGLVFIGNGNQIGRSEKADGWVQYDWFVSYPINNYNVTLNIADYVHFSDTFPGVSGALPLDYYVLPYNLDKARTHFEQVPPMMECYEEFLGPYPFYRDGFALVETPYLGMEHQSAIAYGNAYKNGYLGMDYSRIGAQFDYIIIHEAGHEWWGNSVSCTDVADLWIHESFCTYSESIYMECLYGYEKAMDYINAKRDDPANKRPMIGDYDVNAEGDDIYTKGSLIINTLRHLVEDDEKWWTIFRGIVDEFEYQTLSSAQLEAYLSEQTGIDLTQFFDQYLRHAGIPVLEYKVASKGNKTTLSYRWNADVEGFDMPLKFETGKGESVWVQPNSEWQNMQFKKVRAEDVKPDERHFYFKALQMN